MKKQAKKLVNKIKDDQEKGARKKVIEELFQDFNRSRFQVYKMNFVRGIFFGFGSVIGGTVVIALLIWTLSLLSDTIPAVGDSFDAISQSLESSDK